MAVPFHDIQFPPAVSYGAVGGPGFKTTMFTRQSGVEDRNIEWAVSRATYDLSQAIKTQVEMDQVKAFFMGRFGKGYGFRFKDWTDYKSTSVVYQARYSDQNIGVGDGATFAFSITKFYPDAINPYTRNISRPIYDTVSAAVAGVQANPGVDYIIEDTAGYVVFLPTAVPATGAAVTSGYEFDVPSRFDTDQMQATLDDYNVQSWGQIPIVELKVPSLPFSATPLAALMYWFGAGSLTDLETIEDYLQIVVNVSYPEVTGDYT